MTYHHDPEYELRYAISWSVEELITSLDLYTDISEEEDDLLTQKFTELFKELLPHRWQKMIDSCNKRNNQ